MSIIILGCRILSRMLRGLLEHRLEHQWWICECNADAGVYLEYRIYWMIRRKSGLNRLVGKSIRSG